MAVMYLEESIGTYPRWKSEYPTVGWYPRRLLRKYGSYQQCSCLSTPDARSITIKPWDKVCSVPSKSHYRL